MFGRIMVTIVFVLMPGGVAHGATTLVTPPVSNLGSTATRCTIYNGGKKAITDLQITFRTVSEETLLPDGLIPDTLAPESALDVGISGAPAGVCRFQFGGSRSSVRAAQCRGEAGGTASCVPAQ